MHRSLLFGLVIALAACGQGEPQVAATAVPTVPTTVKETIISEGEPVSTADLSIEGMSCAMMCGNSIKKALAAVPGVIGAEIDFEEGADKPDHAVVTFDPAQVQEGALVKAVEALYDGQYKVTALDITKQVRSTATGTSNTKGASEDGVSASAASLPSILGILQRLVRL